MALWDALAKYAGVSLAILLGAFPRALPAYLSLRSGTPEMLAVEAAQALADGFRAVKIRVGHSDVAQDEDAVRAVLTAFRAAADGVSDPMASNLRLMIGL